VAETVHEEMLRRAAAIIDRAELTGEVVSWLQDYRTWVDGGSPREGFEYVWVPEDDPRWQVLPEPDSRYRCRGQRGCTAPPVVRLNRSGGARPNADARPRWWYYCEPHAFGRRVVDGQLEVRRLLPKGATA
jgi:hypothetical protein